MAKWTAEQPPFDRKKLAQEMAEAAKDEIVLTNEGDDYEVIEAEANQLAATMLRDAGDFADRLNKPSKATSDSLGELGKLENERIRKPKKSTDDVMRELAGLEEVRRAEETVTKRAEKIAKNQAENEARLAQARAAFAKANAEEKARKAQEDAWRSEQVPENLPLDETEKLVVSQMEQALKENLDGTNAQAGETQEALSAMLKESRAYRADEPARKKKWAKEEAAAQLVADDAAYDSLVSPKERRASEVKKARELAKLHDMFESGDPKKLEVLANEHPEWLEAQEAWIVTQLAKLESNLVKAYADFQKAADDYERNEAQVDIQELKAEQRRLETQSDAVRVAKSLRANTPSSLPSLGERTSSVGGGVYGSIKEQGFSRNRQYDAAPAQSPLEAKYSAPNYLPAQKDLEAIAARLQQIPSAGKFTPEQALELAERPITSLSVDEAHSLAMAARELRDTAKGAARKRFEKIHDALSEWWEEGASQRVAKAGEGRHDQYERLTEMSMDNADAMFVALGQGQFFDDKGRHIASEMNAALREIEKSSYAEKALKKKAAARMVQLERFLAAPAVRNAHLEAINEEMARVAALPAKKRPSTESKAPDLEYLKERIEASMERTRRDDALVAGETLGASVIAEMERAETKKNAPREMPKGIPETAADSDNMADEAAKLRRVIAGKKQAPEIDGASPKPFSEASVVIADDLLKGEEAAFGEMLQSSAPTETPAARPSFFDKVGRTYGEVSAKVAELEQDLSEAQRALKEGPASEQEYWQSEAERISDQLDASEKLVIPAFEEELDERLRMMEERFGVPADEIESGLRGNQSTKALAKRMVLAEEAKQGGGLLTRIANALSRKGRIREMEQKLSEASGIKMRLNDATNRLAELRRYEERSK